MKKIFFTSLALVLLTGTASAATYSRNDIIRALPTIAASFSQGLPRMSGTSLQLEKVSAYKDTLVFSARVINKRAKDVSQFARDYLATQEIIRYCLTPELSMFRDNNIDFKFEYRDKNNKWFKTLTINASKCTK